MKQIIISILFLTVALAQEQEDQSKKLTPKENQTIADNMLTIQNLQLQLQGIQLQLEQEQSKHSIYESELAIKYEKVGCTLSLRRDWICPKDTKE